MKPRKPLPKVSKSPHKAAKRFVPLSVLKEVKERSGGICEVMGNDEEGNDLRCRRKAQRQPHHLLGRRAGGKHEASNLLDICWQCHTWVHNYPKEAIEMGLMIPYKGFTNET